MPALRVLSRLAAARNVGLSCSSLRVVRTGGLNLCLRSKVHSPQADSQAFPNTSIRCISQASKDKVNDRNEAIKKDLTIEERVKRIIHATFNVSCTAQEVCTSFLFYLAHLPCRAVATSLPVAPPWEQTR